MRKEIRAWAGSNNHCSVTGKLQECYRQLSYFADGEQRTIKDANGNVTPYCYDGFARLIETDFPDSTGTNCVSASNSEKLGLDNNGNITDRWNRANEHLTYQYDGLDWIRQKVSPNPAVTTSWTCFLNGRVNLLSDTAGNTIDNGYDTAGRLNSVVTTIPGLSGTKTVSYGLDASGNRTQLTWPDAFYVSYCYDNLNRMDGGDARVHRS